MQAIRTILRDETRSNHDGVDTIYSKFDLGAAPSYAAFLSAHARVLPAVEQAIAANNPWSEWSPRADMLLDDLKDLGHKIEIKTPTVEAHDDAARWGMMYVLEGSRLGGAMLAKRVGEGLPSRYLSAKHADGSWQNFLTAMDKVAQAGGRPWIDNAVAAAKDVFRQFSEAAKVELNVKTEA